MSRSIPTECPHGKTIDWGDFGEPEETEACELCGIPSGAALKAGGPEWDDIYEAAWLAVNEWEDERPWWWTLAIHAAIDSADVGPIRNDTKATLRRKLRNLKRRQEAQGRRITAAKAEADAMREALQQLGDDADRARQLQIDAEVSLVSEQGGRAVAARLASDKAVREVIAKARAARDLYAPKESKEATTDREPK